MWTGLGIYPIKAVTKTRRLVTFIRWLRRNNKWGLSSLLTGSSTRCSGWSRGWAFCESAREILVRTLLWTRCLLGSTISHTHRTFSFNKWDLPYSIFLRSTLTGDAEGLESEADRPPWPDGECGEFIPQRVVCGGTSRFKPGSKVRRKWMLIN